MTAPWRVTTWCGGRLVADQEEIDDDGPSFRHTVNIGWRDLVRGLRVAQLQVVIVVEQAPEAGARPALRVVDGGAGAPVKNDGGPVRRTR